MLVLEGNPIDVDREAHELGETLLANQSLCLQIALLNRFSRQYARTKEIKVLVLLFYLPPLSDTELLQCKFEDLYLLLRPPWGQ